MTNNKKKLKNYNHKFSVAPMLDWTDRHCRFFHRIMSKNAVLFTEMITTGALLHGDIDRHLGFNPEESPVILQLGGSDPEALAKSVKIAENYGYDGVNLNCGCPSDRVQKGRFGACLMQEPQLVADCFVAMNEASNLPISIKCRIGVDEQEDEAFLINFIQTIANQGCDEFIIHARKAWLSGLSPKENREIPPLNYQRVYAMKKLFPNLQIVINGGILDLQQALPMLEHVDGVMLGRAAYQNPYLLAEVDGLIYGQDLTQLSREVIIEKILPYIENHLQKGGKLSHITKHILGLFHAQNGGRKWRQILSQNAHLSNAGIEVIQEALECIKIISLHK